MTRSPWWSWWMSGVGLGWCGRSVWAWLRRRQPELPSIEVLRLEPGDILTVTLDHELTKAQADHVQSVFAGKVPGHEVLVLSDTGIKLSVIRPGQYVPKVPDPGQASP